VFELQFTVSVIARNLIVPRRTSLIERYRDVDARCFRPMMDEWKFVFANFIAQIVVNLRIDFGSI
jgi:hypothetical protein